MNGISCEPDPSELARIGGGWGREYALVSTDTSWLLGSSAEMPPAKNGLIYLEEPREGTTLDALVVNLSFSIEFERLTATCPKLILLPAFCGPPRAGGTTSSVDESDELLLPLDEDPDDPDDEEDEDEASSPPWLSRATRLFDVDVDTIRCWSLVSFCCPLISFPPSIILRFDLFVVPFCCC